MLMHYLDSEDATITGGHFYNKKLMEYLLHNLTENIVFYSSLSRKYPSWKKILAPICEVSTIKNFKKNDIVFFGDTSYKYHLLLLLFTYLFTQAKIVIIVHHFPFLGMTGFKGLISYLLQRVYYGMADYIIVPSPYTKSVAEKKFKKKKIEYIPLPFICEYTPSQNFIPGNMLYVGTIEYRKGLIYLMQAAKILKDEGVNFHIDVVGKVADTAYYDLLTTYIKENNLELCISFRGRVSVEELDRYYSQAELFVFPSLLEGYGIVLVEAMKKGLPIVAFDNSAMPYSIVNGQNGYLAKNKDCQDFANKIKLIIGNTEKREVMQRNIGKMLNNLKTEKDFYKSLEEFVSEIRY